MVTVNNILGEHSGTAELELKGLSTDTKPTETFSGYKVGENSVFIELDTGDIYYLSGGAWTRMGNGSGGGAGLPEVTSEDNGKVLKVIEGAWGKGDETGPLTIEVTESSGTVTLPTGVTRQGIYDAYTNGRDVRLRLTTSRFPFPIELIIGLCTTFQDNIDVIFWGILPISTDVKYIFVPEPSARWTGPARYRSKEEDRWIC